MGGSKLKVSVHCCDRGLFTANVSCSLFCRTVCCLCACVRERERYTRFFMEVGSLVRDNLSYAHIIVMKFELTQRGNLESFLYYFICRMLEHYRFSSISWTNNVRETSWITLIVYIEQSFLYKTQFLIFEKPSSLENEIQNFQM